MIPQRKLRRRSNEPLRRYHVSVYEGDIEKLAAFFPQLHPSTIVRELVRTTIRNIEHKLNSKPQAPLEMEIPDDVIESLSRSQPEES